MHLESSHQEMSFTPSPPTECSGQRALRPSRRSPRSCQDDAMATVMRVAMGPLAFLRRGRTVSTAVVNAWQAMADDAEARAERDRLSPGRHSADEGNWLDAIAVDDCWGLLQTAKIGRIGFTAH